MSGLSRPRRLPRALTAVVTAAAALGFSAIVAGAAPTTVPPTHLAAVGPVNPDNGFPAWYRDSTGLTVGQCIDPKDPLCGVLPSSMPDPAAPVQFPGNYPMESFYMLASSRIALPGGLNADLVTGLEASFATKTGPAAGQQVTFGRIRIRIDTPNAGHFVVTHPYGVDEFDAPGAGTRAINFTDDVGIANGVFTGALGSRVNPFLTWDTGPVAGPNGDKYLGDPAVPHRVTGSALGTNVFRIDGPNIGGPGVNTVSTDLFTLSGKLARNFGVDAGHPTYTRSSADGGSVDVFATSVPGETVQAHLPGATPTTLKADSSGRYFARLSFTGAPPPTVQVSNVSDSPPTVVTAKVADRVMVTQATFDTTARTLTVRASSSDTARPPALRVTGFGPLDASGQQVFGDVDVPPQEVTVSSDAGGSDSAPVTVDGAASLPNPVMASAGPDQTVRQGQKVTLDATASRNATALAWSQTGGQAVLLGQSGPVATFTAPDQDATLTFRLTAQGPGGPTSDEVTVTVAGLAPPTASVGAERKAYAGDLVTLDASSSDGVDSYSWQQGSGPMVALAGSSTARPSFTMPVSTVPLVFTLTTTGPGGSATATVTVTPEQDILAVTQVSYRSSTHEWRVVGTATAPSPDLVTVRLSAGDTLVGTAAVDSTGAWAVRVKGSLVAPDGSGTVAVTTSRGGTVSDYPVSVSP
ncbi:MAG: PKD domain-containing protein [Oryzihumus sp.]